MAEGIPPIERRGDDFVLRLDGVERRYRAVVPRELLDDEIGAEATEADRRAWIEANLAGILSAVTARESGGFVQAPWGRILVEEVP